MTPDLVDQLVTLAPILPETPERATYLDSTAALAASALAYAAAGWPVFPLAAGGKVPVTTNGVKDATTDRDTVAEWWRTMPACNIGVACGVRFDCVDIDAPDGFDSWAEFCVALEAVGQPLPQPLAVARTGNGGAHLFVTAVPGAKNGARLGGKPGLDYRATGGYVVLSPSRLAGGSRYKWALPPDHRLLGAT